MTNTTIKIPDFYTYGNPVILEALNYTLANNTWRLPINSSYVKDILMVLKYNRESIPLTEALYNMLLGVINQINQEKDEIWDFRINVADIDLGSFFIDLGANSTKKMFYVSMFDIKFLELKLGSLINYDTPIYIGNIIKDYIKRWMITT